VEWDGIFFQAVCSIRRNREIPRDEWDLVNRRLARCEPREVCR
jgi:hypothetical protein